MTRRLTGTEALRGVMFTTAAYLLHYAIGESSGEPEPGEGFLALVLLAIFMWYDYQMALVLAG